MPEESILDDLGGNAGGAGPIMPPEKRGRFRRRQSGTEGAKRPAQKTDKELRDGIRKFFRDVAPGLAEFAGDDYDAKVVRANADRLADAYLALAKDSPRFRVLLETILTAGGSFAGAVFATAAVTLPILHHHRVISLPPFMGLAFIGEPLEVHETTEPEPEENERGRNDAADGGRVAASPVG